MILAAGLGTRLLPFTRTRPKPLFTLGGRPLLDILIRQLQEAGFQAIVVNTHHLSAKIRDFVDRQIYDVPVVIRHEPEILGTGGAIKNVADFWDDDPLLVVNGDIFTNIDFRSVYDFHRSQDRSVTMALHDCQAFNTVRLDAGNRVVDFRTEEPPGPDSSLLAFTGIHVLGPEVLNFIPDRTFVGIIEVYEEMMKAGETVGGLVIADHFWHDIGTPAGYGGAATEALARKTLGTPTSAPLNQGMAWSGLEGDGSDRIWHRVRAGNDSIVVANHGLCPETDLCEADAFVAIGRHLETRGVPVPHIYDVDRPAGIVAMEDLGDHRLQDVILAEKDRGKTAARYRAVIDILIVLGLDGAKGFDTAWAYQTPYYDRQVILERECHYFLEQFVKTYTGLDIDSELLEGDFDFLAARGTAADQMGLIHRDFQSRNILVRDDDYCLIDFQGARLGPLAYDLASLLIDPYVNLDHETEEELFDYYLNRLTARLPVDPKAFRTTYRHCAVNRNLQALGAFAFLTQVKKKPHFETYIPRALDRLKFNLGRIEPGTCNTLKELVDRL